MTPLYLLSHVKNGSMDPHTGWSYVQANLDTHFVWPCVAAGILKKYPSVQSSLYAVFQHTRRFASDPSTAADMKRIARAFDDMEHWLTQVPEEAALMGLGIWAAQTQHRYYDTDRLVQSTPWRDAWNVSKNLHSTDLDQPQAVLLVFQQFVGVVRLQQRQLEPLALCMPVWGNE